MGKEFLDGYKTYDPSEEGFGSPYEWKRNFHRRMSKEEAQEILQEDDPYVILEVTPRSSQAEIKKSFYRLAMKWHPDRNPDKIELATSMMQRINAAYSILMN
jgi:DnaJ-class molecular chaperone